MPSVISKRTLIATRIEETRGLMYTCIDNVATHLDKYFGFVDAPNRPLFVARKSDDNDEEPISEIAESIANCVGEIITLLRAKSLQIDAISCRLGTLDNDLIVYGERFMDDYVFCDMLHKSREFASQACLAAEQEAQKQVSSSQSLVLDALKRAQSAFDVLRILITDLEAEDASSPSASPDICSRSLESRPSSDKNIKSKRINNYKK